MRSHRPKRDPLLILLIKLLLRYMQDSLSLSLYFLFLLLDDTGCIMCGKGTSREVQLMRGRGREEPDKYVRINANALSERETHVNG